MKGRQRKVRFSALLPKSGPSAFGPGTPSVLQSTWMDCGVKHGEAVSATYTVRLACAHLDHDPTNNDPPNLRALCQRCHILHDMAEHIRRR